MTRLHKMLDAIDELRGDLEASQARLRALGMGALLAQTKGWIQACDAEERLIQDVKETEAIDGLVDGFLDVTRGKDKQCL